MKITICCIYCLPLRNITSVVIFYLTNWSQRSGDGVFVLLRDGNWHHLQKKRKLQIEQHCADKNNEVVDISNSPSSSVKSSTPQNNSPFYKSKNAAMGTKIILLIFLILLPPPPSVRPGASHEVWWLDSGIVVSFTLSFKQTSPSSSSFVFIVHYFLYSHPNHLPR